MKSFNIKASLSFSIILILLTGSVSLFAGAELLDNKISLDATDGKVSNIIATMAQMSDCNIVLAMATEESSDQDSAADKKITIHLKDVPIEQALSLVVKSVGLSYRLIGENTFIVGDKKKIDEEIGERTYVVHLNYVEATKIVDAMKGMPGIFSEIKGQNALIIRANPNTYAETIKRIEEIDVPQKQIEIRARLIEVHVSEAEKYGIDWQKLNKLTTIIAEDPTNANGVGLPYGYTDDTGAIPHGNLEDFNVVPEDQYFQKLDGFNDIGHFSRQLTAFDITLDFLLENNAAELLTDTHITALNGEEGYIHIGEVVPYVVRDEDDEVQVEREEVGIMLRVRPKVNRDNQITTTIEPEVSSVTELVQGRIPRTKVRKITSTVTVPNGHRIIVGGLLSTNIITTNSNLPFLSDIPYIGGLFKHKSVSMEKTDLIIEITPRIVDINDVYNYKLTDDRLDKRILKEETEEE
ncbi:MAG: secretin and TonB N-terminal domain-containing protein [Candidatus Stygibacter australis]|nr:secretin and TonB N-terminal domain-containing protein [Candidatus Stygibacter australis]MDP8322471.1 secretin and TonB N-terminal domain-containing protein [Candidatus Stygibacter australis]